MWTSVLANKAAAVANRPAIAARRPAFAPSLSARSPKVATTARAAEAQASPFSAVDSEEALFAILKAGAGSGQVPPRLIGAVSELYTNYKAAIMGSGLEGADEAFVARVMASVCERVLMQLNPAAAYTFPSFHERILEPYNYYNFGQRYIRGLIDFTTSMLGNEAGFKEVEQQLKNGENVVLLANHQTEADPAVFALLLEAAFPDLATDVIYVAGDRVVTDPLCKPFSMGRNLFCVHSKKHMGDDPEVKAEKMATNRKTLRAMQNALNEGGKLLWIAPSGGRDRAVDEKSGENIPDPFDPSAVELMRALITKAKPAGHLRPFAMYSYKIMPPPKVVKQDIGEERLVFHAPVGISLGEELDVESILAGIEDKEERQKRLAEAAFQQTTDEYYQLVDAISNPEKKSDRFSQPFASQALKF
jgi:glycerol-3-phosphate O-acyltransferase